MTWAEDSNQDLALILLDFEKAYDRISWTFLQAALKEVGFSDNWIKWIMALHTEAEALITINGEQGTPFRLERSGCQGCPLAPYLFLFAADALGYMLDDYKHKVEGLISPDTSRHTTSMFADDTSLFLKGDCENLNNTMKVLDINCKASGAKINWNKTSVI